MLLLLSAAFAGTPVWPTLSAAEQAKFDKGELVLRADTSTDKTVSTGMASSTAPLGVLWAESLDFEAKKAENPSVTRVEEYARISPDEWFVVFDLSVFGVKVTIHDHWTCTPATYTCTFRQDPAKKSDVREEEGYMILKPHARGSAIVFHAQFISEVWAPGWIRQWLAKDNMVMAVDKLRERAERRSPI